MSYRIQARSQDAVITKEPTDPLYRWSARVNDEFYVGEAKRLRDAKAAIAEMYAEKILWQTS